MAVRALTMVARYGDNDKNVVAYLIVSGDYRAKMVKSGELARMISANPAAFTNLELDANGKIKSSNGDMNNYVLVHPATNQLLTKPRNVILSRIEKNGKLTGYTIYTSDFNIAEINVKQAAELANNKLIANGKIRHTDDGDIVSSIKGNYPLVEVRVQEAEKKDSKTKLTVDVMLIGHAVLQEEKSLKDLKRYFCATVKCESIARMSKIAQGLRADSYSLIQHLKKYGGERVAESLALKKLPDGSVYGAYNLEMLKELKSAGAEISMGIKEKGNAAIFSLIKYDKEGGNLENTIIVDGNTMEVRSRSGEAGDKLFEVLEKDIKVVSEIVK